jgi:hypothetical protein
MKTIDDLLVDGKRNRIYICGEGFVDLLAADGAFYRQTAHFATAGGAARTLFMPKLDRLLLAVTARGKTSAAIWVFRPPP